MLLLLLGHGVVADVAAIATMDENHGLSLPNNNKFESRFNKCIKFFKKGFQKRLALNVISLIT